MSQASINLNGQPNFGQPNFGSAPSSPATQPNFGQGISPNGIPLQGTIPSSYQSGQMVLNFGTTPTHDQSTGFVSAQQDFPGHASHTPSPPSSVQGVATNSSTGLVPASHVPHKDAPVKTFVTIDEIDTSTQTMEVVVYRGGQMVRGQGGKMMMMNYNNPVAIKVTAPEKKTISGRTKKSKPGAQGTQTAESDNKPKDPNYWLTGIQYNYGTESNPQWRKGLTYTFGQSNPVWFSPVTEDVDYYEETADNGQAKEPTKVVTYKTSCRLDKNSAAGQKVIAFYDDLRVVLALALKSPANGSPAADAIGLAEMDPGFPKDTEIRRFYNQRMDNGVPDPTADPTKYFTIASYKDKITASFMRPIIINGLLMHKAGLQFYLLDTKTKVFFACDKDGNFTQIDPSTQQPTPIPVSNFPHGSIAPEYVAMDPLTLKNKEYLGVPVSMITGFYTSSGKASGQEKIRGMIVLDTRDTQRGAQVKELGGTFDFTGETEIDYTSVAERFASLGINTSTTVTPTTIAPVEHSGAPQLTAHAHLDNFTGGIFN